MFKTKLNKAKLLLIFFILFCFVINFTNLVNLNKRVYANSNLDVTFDSGIVKIPEKVKLGEDFNIPSISNYTCQVLDPNGNDVIMINNNKITTAQCGYYSINYKNTNKVIVYEHKVLVYSGKYEPSLEVVFNYESNSNSIIPKNCQKGDKIKLPKVRLALYDDLFYYDVIDFKKGLHITISDANGTIKDASGKDKEFNVGDEYSFDNPGIYNIRFAIDNGFYDFYKGEDSKAKDIIHNYVSNLYKDFTINVQNSFSNDVEPTLSVDNTKFSSTASLNQRFNLPTATVKNNDNNSVVNITVKDVDNKEVLVATKIDSNGYATEWSTDNVNVIFDNNKRNYFYPQKVGTYSVEYKAVNYNGKTAIANYHINVKDNVAPSIKTIDNWQIPDKWGLNSGINIIDNNNKVANVQNLYLPFYTSNEVMKEVTVNNKPNDLSDPSNRKIIISHNPSQKLEDITIGLSVYYDLTNKEVLRIKNFNVSDPSSQKNSIKTYCEDGWDWDITQPLDFNKLKTGAGDYDIKYIVTGNDYSNEVSYRITVQNATPEIKKNEIPALILDDIETIFNVDDKNSVYTIKTPVASDTNFTRLNVKYTMKIDNRLVDIKGGEKLDFANLTLDNQPIIDEQGKTISKITSNVITFTATVKNITNKNYNNNGQDDVTVTKTMSIYGKAGANVYNSNTQAPKKLINDNGWETDSKVYPTTASDVLTTIKLKTNEVTGFSANIYYMDNGTKVYRNDFDIIYTRPYSITNNEETLGQNSDTIIKICNLKLNNNYNNYVFELDAFDLNGNHEFFVRSFIFDSSIKVKAKFANKTNNFTNNLNSAMPSNIDVGVYTQMRTYKASDIISPTPTTYYLRRHFTVNGGRFAIVDDKFKALTTDTFTIDDWLTTEESVAKQEKDPNETDNKGKDYHHVSSNPYDVLGKDSNKPIIVYNESMQQRWNYDKTNQDNNIISLPHMSAYANEGQIYEKDLNVKCELINGSDKIDVSMNKPNTTYNGITTKTIPNWWFKASKAGKYQITVTAQGSPIGNSGSSSDTFTIYVGDLVAPDVTVTAPSNTSLKLNDKFNFNRFNNLDKLFKDSTDSTKYDYVKVLTAPDGTETKVEGTITNSSDQWNSQDRINNGDSFILDQVGSYSIKYTLTNNDTGISTVFSFDLSVVDSSGTSSGFSNAIGITLIILAVIFIIGSIVYFVQFRKVKVTNNNNSKFNKNDTKNDNDKTKHQISINKENEKIDNEEIEGEDKENPEDDSTNNFEE